MDVSPMNEDALALAVPATGTRARSISPRGLVAGAPIESAFIFTLAIAITPSFVV